MWMLVIPKCLGEVCCLSLGVGEALPQNLSRCNRLMAV